MKAMPKILNYIIGTIVTIALLALILYFAYAVATGKLDPDIGHDPYEYHPDMSKEELLEQWKEDSVKSRYNDSINNPSEYQNTQQ